MSASTVDDWGALDDAADADSEFTAHCSEIPFSTCQEHSGDAAHQCNGCPAWEAFKERFAAKTKGV